LAKKGIEVRELVKRYSTKIRKGFLRSETKVIEALRGISFDVHHGEVVGLLGPNGAGKTTTIKILATLLLPDSGDAFIEGYSVVKEPHKVRECIGVMLTVEKGFYPMLTGKENLEYFGRLYGLKGNYLKKRVEEILDLVGLKELGAADRIYEEYSLGMRARLSLARALLPNPPILLLDEPTLGLDPPSARRIRELVKNLVRKDGKAVLYTTHNMFEAEIICDRILLIDKGVIIASGTPAELKKLVRGFRAIVLKLREEVIANKLIKILNTSGYEKISKIKEGELVNVKILVEDPERELTTILKLATSHGLEIDYIAIQEPSLEDVFIELTGAKE